MAEALPEGTDQIVPGAGSNNNRDEDDGTSRSSPPPLDTEGLKDSIKSEATAKAAELKDQYVDQARDYAEQGKERASAGLDSAAKMIGDAAGQVDSALGATYGDYLRRAAGSVSDLSDTLRDKDVDELVADARDLVRRSPTIAIGAAAAAGFLIARILKAGGDVIDEGARTISAKSDASASTAKSPKPSAAD